MADILVVDDEPLICEMLDVFLSRVGHNVTTAEDGEKALTSLNGKSVDLVVVDIVMPEKDGLETISTLRKTFPNIKIIAISGGSRIGDYDFLAMAKKLGACETFYKPLDNQQLLEAIEKHMNAPSVAQ